MRVTKPRRHVINCDADQGKRESTLENNPSSWHGARFQMSLTVVFWGDSKGRADGGRQNKRIRHEHMSGETVLAQPVQKRPGIRGRALG